MIVFLLILIAAVLLLGSAAVFGIASVLFWAIVVICGAIYLGISGQALMLMFVGFLGLVFVAYWALPFAPDRLPSVFKFNRKQKAFLANIDEYHKLKDELQDTQRKFLWERVKGERADPAELKLLQQRIESLEINLARFN